MDEKSCVTPAGTSNEFDVQNMGKKTHTHNCWLQMSACDLGTALLLKKILNASIDLLSIPQSGEEMPKRLDRIIGCNYKTSSWHLNGFPDGSNIRSTVYCNTGEKPTVMLYTYIKRHAGAPDQNKNKNILIT